LQRKSRGRVPLTNGFFGEAHLRRVLRGAYAWYYNVIRTHCSLHKEAPLHRLIQCTGIPK
jgi:hypothetical protein